MAGKIITRAGILGGKPYIRGTRLTVEFIEQQLADGVIVEELLAGNPELSKESLDAARRYTVQVEARGLTRPGHFARPRPHRRSQPSPIATDIFVRGY